MDTSADRQTIKSLRVQRTDETENAGILTNAITHAITAYIMDRLASEIPERWLQQDE